MQALLPFPSVLELMASKTTAKSERLRLSAVLAGLLLCDQSISQRAVAPIQGYALAKAMTKDGGDLKVPYYDPAVVFSPPQPGFSVRGAIRFGAPVSLGQTFDTPPWPGAFVKWGWGFSWIDWDAHAVFLEGLLWERVWTNRHEYVHSYPYVHRWDAGQRIERHKLIPRTEREREADRTEPRRVEEHHRHW